MAIVSMNGFKAKKLLNECPQNATVKAFKETEIPGWIEHKFNFDQKNWCITVSGLTSHREDSKGNPVKLVFDLKEQEINLIDDEENIICGYKDHALTTMSFTLDPKGNMHLLHQNPFGRLVLREEMGKPLLKLLESKNQQFSKQHLISKHVVIEFGKKYHVSTYYVASVELHNWFKALFYKRYVHNLELVKEVKKLADDEMYRVLYSQVA